MVVWRTRRPASLLPQILNFKGIPLETMFFRTVSMMSQNLRDQLTRNFKYAFSTRDYSPYQNRQILFFYILPRLPKFNKNVQKSIIEKTSKYRHFFNYRLFSFVLVPAIAKLMLIKEHSRFFISDKQNGRNRPFFKSDYVWEYCSATNFNFFLPKKF